MSRPLSYKKVNAYFEDLATKHFDIDDYCGTSPSELGSKSDSTLGLRTTLVFYDYSGKLSGNEQRTFNNRAVSFSIVIPGVKLDDYRGQDDAIDKCEAIGLEVLSRINIQSKMPEIGWLYNNFVKESVTMATIRNEEAIGFWGMDFSFELKTLEPLVVNPDKWSDGAMFCE
ncbi:hypothetical protein [Flavobacterium sp. 14A]|uniref:hypothetical protein n=1 Tax=Flavobacterium sp. 14A TaxID=2735896 RepID=UPI00156F9076|nr:hypothetical protein [Flavobacterium sp. 14A]NRT11538.1 hypothetical protein [Flavobacterium sp. 14A]